MNILQITKKESKVKSSDNQEVLWRQWEETLHDCQNCSLYQTRHNVVCGNGNYGASVALLGEAPGSQEDICGQPFAGAAGSLLTDFLLRSGLSREKLYIGNIVKCRPVAPGKKEGTFTNRRPTKREMEACAPHLWRELELLRPCVIVTLGLLPLSRFLPGTSSIGEQHGQPFHHHELDMDIFPLYHPAAMIYNRSLAQTYETDLSILYKFLLCKGIIEEERK